MLKTGEPVPAGLYCRSCRYELRGLTTYCCPECGNSFDPSRRESVSIYPTRQRELAAGIDDTVAKWMARSKDQTDRLVIARLAANVAHLFNENAELRSSLMVLGRLLVEKGILSETELHERLERIDLYESGDSETESQILNWLGDAPPGAPDSPPPSNS